MDPCIAIALACALERKKSKKRTKWAKKWLLNREQFGHMQLLKELSENEPLDFRNFLRMDEVAFKELLGQVTPYIERKTTIMRDPISPEERLSITLRFLATGNSFEDLKFMSAISPQAIGRIVIETCDAIIICLKSHMKFPTSEEEWKRVSKDFAEVWNFPHCVGAIDGKHVSIKKPPCSGSYFYNYKGFFSIILMAIVNANYEFMMVDVGVNGRVSDGGVISVIPFGKKLTDNDLALPEPEPLHDDDAVKIHYVYIADDAFAMSVNLLKPYSGLEGVLDLEKIIFNYRLSRARRVVENAFGILASRFGIFQKPISLSPEKAQTITLACCYLHNFLRKKSGKYFVRGSVDWEDGNKEIHEGEWRASQNEFEKLQSSHCRNPSAKAKATRDLFSSYFNSRGSLSWQMEHVS